MKNAMVCIDSYQDGALKGSLETPYDDAQTFDSTIQFLKRMESILEETQTPQAYTYMRSFLEERQQREMLHEPTEVGAKCLASFEIKVIFRQHSSWQGVVVWLEKQWEQSFRSVLELILLMDSALRTEEGSDPL